MSSTSSAPETGAATPRNNLDLEFSIVSGSREQLLFECIASIHDVLRDSRYTWQITATCNTPGTGLAQRLVERFPALRTIENAEQRGFAANHNTVLASSTARYVWLLNDDLVLLPDSIELVTKFMDAPENALVAVVSPRLLNPDGSLQPSTYSFPSMPQTLLAYSGLRERALTDRLLRLAAPILRARKGSSRFWDHDATLVVDTLRGACVAVRMAAVREVGPMTEVALVGSEETEWHHRFHARGWKVVFFAGASVIHHGSQTVADGSRNLYPEYLKGALYFFRTRRPAPLFAVFCASLLAMYGAQIFVARLRRDPIALDLARRYAAVTRNAMRSLPATPASLVG
jgi:N-acetylglucosaminyl-diphospho-decaprenol L-rhamnosyltransferase